MKKQGLLWITIVLAFVLSTVAIPQSNVYEDPSLDYRTIENNYLEGLESDNQGLRISCAFYLGEMKSQRAVIPLMKMMGKEDHEGAKIIAAWSLIKIGDQRGIYRVKKEAELSNSCAIKCMCEYFHRQHLETQKSEVAEKK